MSEVITPPPPPPPPPPSPDQPKAAFDFVKPFAFVFEDARWINKVLIGGIFQLLSALLVGIPFLLGYLAQLVRNVVANATLPLPEWDDLGEMFNEGLRLIGVAIVYFLPLLAILAMIMIPMIVVTAAASHHNDDFDPGGLFACVWCLFLPLTLVYAIWMPAALMYAIVEQRFGAAFEFARIWRFISNNVGNYLLAVVVMFVARFASGFGIVLFCVGIFFTVFWAMCVTFYAFAQTWKLATVK
ncbi:MAG TPA: DUF4013 domain-containing protein [Thermoanaerobaculia bacterium]|nr:DUF4013 domain-containing protein [Thermoanaerobaculia bacterium]